MSFSVPVWVQAARPLAQGNIAPPLIFGQALAYWTTHTVDWATSLIVFAFGVFDHLFIIFANDYADREADAKNGTYNVFSGGSRVLVEGRLAPASLRRAALLMVVLLGLTASVLAARGASFALVGFAAAVALMQAYSFAPARLSYRGGGELLQGLGVGVVLPLIGFHAQAPTSTPPSWTLFIAAFFMCAAGNVVTALPDTPADAIANKRTWAVRVGEVAAGWHATLAIGGAAVLFAVALPGAGLFAKGAIAGSAIVVLGVGQRMFGDATARDRRRMLGRVLCLGGAMTIVWLGGCVALVSAVP